MSASAGTLREQLRAVASAPDFRVLLATFVLQALATGAMLAGVDYVARYVIGDSGAASLLFACFVAPALLVTPVWQRVGERRGKKVGYVAAAVLLAAGALLLSSARVAPEIVIFVATALAGIGYAGAQVFPLAMLPDTAAVDAVRSGQNRAGVFTGIWTAGETLGLALGPGLYAVVLSIGGYVSSAEAVVTQPGSALNAIVIGFSTVPAVLIAMSLLTLRRYRLNREQVETARKEEPRA